jgi:hypothetical protein
VHTLPHDYDCRHWRTAWVGFDMLEVLCLAATAVLGFLHRHLVVLVSPVTGVLFLCDAWFDITTAGPHDVGWSVLTAVLAEILARGAVRGCGGASSPTAGGGGPKLGEFRIEPS